MVPGLVTILVGQNPASMSYVTAKSKTSKEIGFHSDSGEPPGDYDGGGSPGVDRSVQPGSRHPRDSGTAATPEAYQRDEGALRHRSEEGRRRLPSGECGEDDDRRGGLPPLHPGGDPAAPDPFRGQDRRCGGGRRGEVEHRGQADRQHPASETEGGECNGDYLPYGDAGHGVPHAEGRRS